MHSGLGIRGFVVVRGFRGGRLLFTRRSRNRFVATGQNAIMERAAGIGSSPISHMALGSGFTPVRLGDTALENEVYRDQLTTLESPAPGEITARLIVPENAANGNDIWEAGLFDAATGGTMFARSVLSEDDFVEKTASITLQLTWTASLENIVN